MLPKHYSEQQIKYFFTSDAVAARPVSWELALHVGDPGEGDANEVTDANYERIPVDFVASDQGGFWQVESVSDAVFDAAAAGALYTVTHFSVRDAGTGEALAIAALPVPIPVVENGVISFASGDLIVRGVTHGT